MIVICKYKISTRILYTKYNMGQVFAVPQPLSASVNKSAEVLSKKLECDENCEREKKLKKLKDKLDDKKDNLKTAPLQVHDARREYMQYKFGIVGYISRRKSELQKEGKAAEEKIVSDWNKKRNDAVIAVKNYRELLNFFSIWSCFTKTSRV